MSRVHIYPAGEQDLHNLRSADCRCEPRIIDEGFDNEGDRALVFVHSYLSNQESIFISKRENHVPESEK